MGRRMNLQIGHWPLVIGTLFIILVACTSLQDATWERVRETGVLRVGMDASFPPFETIAADGTLVGFDVDLARELGRRLGPTLSPSTALRTGPSTGSGHRPSSALRAGADGSSVAEGVEVQFVANLPYDGLYDALTADRVDVVISALVINPARMADFAYSTSYFDAGQVLVVREGESRIDGGDKRHPMADLSEHTLAVEFGTRGDQEARRWERRLADLTVEPCQTAAEALAKVAAREADAALVDHVSALAATKTFGLVIVGEAVVEEPYAVATRRDSPRLLRAINEALAEMEADGTLGALSDKWLAGGP